MINFESLKDKIEKADDVVLFAEIELCYKNNLYRAGYLLAWIILIESLKRKIIELSDLDDKRGKSERLKIESMEKSHYSVDVQILVSAKDCEIISDFEYTTLNSLWQQRCLFAHPYMQKVEAVDFVYIINKLVDITLSKPLSYTKNMIDDFLDSISKSPHIIPNLTKEKSAYIQKKIILIQQKHYPYFFKSLFFCLSKDFDANNVNLASFWRLFILEFFLRNDININDPSFGIEKQLIDFPIICWIIFCDPTAWQKLSNIYQETLFRFYESLEVPDTKGMIHFVQNLIENCPSIENSYKDIYYNQLQKIPIVSSLSFYIDKSILLERIWEEQIKGWIYSKQMQFVEFLESINPPLSEYFNDEQSEKLGNFLGLCCFNNTYKAISFAKAKKNTWITNDHFCKGFIMALLVKAGKPQVSSIGFNCLLTVLDSCSSELSNEIMTDLETIFKDENTHNEYNYEIIKGILESNKDIFSDKPLFERLNTLLANYYV